jgi:AraC-like DNA-binding protein
MGPPSAIDVVRVEALLRSIYRQPFLALGHLLDVEAENAGCDRRQFQRAFKVFGTSAQTEVREIRAELGAAMLTQAEQPPLKVIAKRIGLRDDRALRREIGAAWGVSPGALRDAADLQQTINFLHRSRILRGEEDLDAGLVSSLKQRKRKILESCPIRTKRLVEGELALPTPKQAAADYQRLATQRVAQLQAAVLHESQLPA